jgi:hypothetical protein
MLFITYNINMSSASSLKEELFKLKNKLETIEGQLTTQSNEIETREGKWSRIEKNLNYVIGTQGDRVRLNIGGKIFSTSINTLLTIRDSFLARLVESGRVDLKDEIFIDRNPDLFHLIIDYYRYKTISYKGLSKNEVCQLRDDAHYYAISEISDYLDEMLKEPVIIDLEIGKEYLYQGKVAGTNKASDLNDPDLNLGVCCSSPGKILVELNAEYNIKGLEVAGWNGDSKIWYPDNGSNAKIFVSTDKKKWTQIGTIPQGFGKTVKSVKITKQETGKFIKFESNSYLGLGFLKVIKSDEFN